MAVESVAVVSIPVSDQERAKAFYVDTLGLELVRDDSSVPGMRWIHVRPNRGDTQFSLVNWFETMPAGSLQGLVLRSDDLEAEYRRLVAEGVEFEGPPEQQPWRMETVCRDPVGNKLVLHQA
jgi:predicted enzyme related to lactoylglutathione lyase